MRYENENINKKVHSLPDYFRLHEPGRLYISTVVSKEALYAKCDRGAVGTLTIATDKTRFTINEATCRINNDTLIVTGINRTNTTQRQIITDSIAMADLRYIEVEEYDSGETFRINNRCKCGCSWRFCTLSC